MTISSSTYSLPTVGIVGAGKLGSVLAAAFGARVEWIVCHSQGKALELREKFDSIPIYTSINEITQFPDITFLTVSDRNINKVAEELAVVYNQTDEIKTVIHCSGALGLDELSSCKAAGMHAVAAHPFQTFIGEDTNALQGIAWGIECEQDDEVPVKALVGSLGGIPVILSAETRANKALYHASAVVASNFVTMLVEVAREFAIAAGINDMFLAPIIRQAVENSLETLHTNSPLPLTGPIARVDITTLQRHHDALANTPLGELYSILSQATANVAFHNNLISSDEYEIIKNVVKE